MNKKLKAIERLIFFLSITATLIFVTTIEAGDGDRGNKYDTLFAEISFYNAVEGQTDTTPCIFADGKNHCDKQDNILSGEDIVVACPRNIALGTRVWIENIGNGICRDRMNARYTHRFDVLTHTREYALARGLLSDWRVEVFNY